MVRKRREEYTEENRPFRIGLNTSIVDEYKVQRGTLVRSPLEGTVEFGFMGRSVSEYHGPLKNVT